MKKYLGIDPGSKSLGLAISDSGIIASTYKTLYFEENNYLEAINLIHDIITLEHIDVCVIGLPKHMNNDLGVRGEISVLLKEKLEEKLKNVKFVLWDERSSTKQAIKTLVSANVSRKKQKQLKDELAAQIILQNYLDSL